MAIAHDLDRSRLADREMTDRDDEFVGVGDAWWRCWVAAAWVRCGGRMTPLPE
jgi:hypothetical protein